MRTESGYRRLRRRYDEPGHGHYLTFSCFHNQDFLRSQRACSWLLQQIREAKSKHDFELWAWVFMPNHVHLLIRPGPGSAVGLILRAIKEPLSKRVSYWVRKNAPEFLPRMMDVQPSGRRSVRFWQPGGGYDRSIVSCAELREKLAYIHNNPVRLGLAETPDQWKWSSYRAWQTGADGPLPIDPATLPALNA